MSILSELPTLPLFDGIAGRVLPGDGDKVLWLHGYTLDSSSWGDMWERLPGWYHIGIDFPGHGGSESITKAGTLPELARRIGQFCVDEDIRHLAALSFGTITAIQICIEFPKHFSSVALGAPSLAGGPEDPEIDKLYGSLYAIYYQRGVGLELQDTWINCKVWDGAYEFPEFRQELASLVRKHTWEELGAYTTMMNLTQPAQVAEMLSPIEASMLVVIGEHEMPPFRECTRILCEVVPGCTQQEIPDAGHLCFVQSPEASAKLIDAHLRAHAVHPPGGEPG